MHKKQIMKDLQIVFMGTPDFAVTTLKHLHENGYKIAGVITAPDRPAGRGQKIRTSAVKDYATSQNLTVLQPTNLKDEAFLSELADLKADIQIIVAFRMLPRVVWAMPKLGTFNLHASLLPQYRGAAPINWAIINGESETGNTTFFIDDKIDTGQIILQEKIAIGSNETAGELHDRLMNSGAKLVAETLNLIESGTVNTKPQPDYEPKTAYKLNKENTKIDWSKEGEKIHNLIRGLSPYPSAWCTLINADKSLAVKIHKASISNKKSGFPAGKIWIEDKNIKVATIDSTITILNLQLPGKKAMPANALLNGFSFDDEAFFK